MENKDKRQLALKQIRNTLTKIARLDDTCNLDSLLQEICTIYGVSLSTATTYIKELELMKIACCDWSKRLIWHENEIEIRKIYLETKQDIEVIKI